MGEMRNEYKTFNGRPEVKTRPGVLCVSGKIILQWILNMSESVYWIYLLQSSLASWFCEPCNERSGSVRCGGNLLEQLSCYKLFN
jgi:hypothetical protein